MARKSRTHLVNPGIAGVVYDEAGHSLGGGERIDASELDAVGRAAVDTGQLMLDTPGPEPAEPKPEQQSRRERRSRDESDADTGASEPE